MRTPSRVTSAPGASGRQSVVGRSRSIQLLLYAGLAMGCTADSTSEPSAEAAAMATLAVRPSNWLVSLNDSNPFVQLEIVAYDGNGRAVGTRGAPRYSSDSPAIATVSSSGVVTALSPGATRVRVAVTDAGVTRNASVAVVVSPPTVPTIESLSVHPTEAVLIAEPGQTLQLTVEAHDEQGDPIRNAPTYSSSAPEVATVSGMGLIEAVGPGTARITTALTVSGVTRTDSMTVSVISLPMINGVYDLTASITTFDPAWGYDLSDAGYTATLTLGHDPGSIPGIAGTFSDLRLTGREVEPHAPMSGVVTSTVGLGRIEIELATSAGNFHLYLSPGGDLHGPVMQGRFGCCGHISGTFTAVRRGGP